MPQNILFEKVADVEVADAVAGHVHEIHRNDEARVVVGDAVEGPEFPCAGFIGGHQVGDLPIGAFTAALPREIDFTFPRE